MNAYIITGSSSGIGYSLTNLILEKNENKVFGISRTNKIDHINYNHIFLDLSKYNQIENLKLPLLKGFNKIYLINNAGWIGGLKPIGRLKNKEILNSYMINLVGPCILMNYFIKFYNNNNATKIILNVNSGASKSPIPSWNTYCSSKSGLKMISDCVNFENKDIISLSICPGKVDINMQKEIRNSNTEDFPDVEIFREFYSNNNLKSPNKIAEKLLFILNNPKKYINLNKL